ncbi:pollen-specific leucine-rich repeat extensin-like protein 1 [Camponotus floridanus]|uniref:pollen-specific leucine-rich repeat extensin-like protein 1 n=1 Tax=Camponotus floridanus TaxID=104421 RepID=UPI000DC69614|nr:pollen-specific leucine-rich repeat extensin-like protein 1 [Camponotus floridanus]
MTTAKLNTVDHFDSTCRPSAPPAPSPEPQEQPPPPRPPRVGTTIQRSDRVEQKWLMLLVQPPPLPGRRPIRSYEKQPKPMQKIAAEPPPEEILRPMGPMTAPPIKVEIEPGLIVEVPHFAVHVSRRYKPRTPQGRWILRFSGDGKLRYKRKID